MSTFKCTCEYMYIRITCNLHVYLHNIVHVELLNVHAWVDYMTESSIIS